MYFFPQPFQRGFCIRTVFSSASYSSFRKSSYSKMHRVCFKDQVQLNLEDEELSLEEEKRIEESWQLEIERQMEEENSLVEEHDGWIKDEERRQAHQRLEDEVQGIEEYVETVLEREKRREERWLKEAEGQWERKMAGWKNKCVGLRGKGKFAVILPPL